MPEPIRRDPAAALEAEQRYATAQHHAYAWMAKAQEAEDKADHVVEHERHRQGWPDIAVRHRKDADRAMVFARAWARVAAAIVPPLPAVESVLEIVHPEPEEG
ncbi:hypothetical protein [Streptomyces sp. NPDC001091]